ncbi:hypothetical protein HCC61_00280 [Streptomyces sp. HNM0575]|uniref:hypothetical protein n=1 Tax=Streptomyces sp. HNM0575 TaxID=2716338 RepID=UPI00145C3E65|nr:hypothetical protein [Streptomyces sp. HNM0575]NLU71155.1 hypothetical protein [Streptomyces sp. HNM0575]
MDNEADPNRFLYITGLIAGSLFALGYWAILVVSLFTGDFTVGGLLITVLVSGAAWAGFLGWRRQQVAYSWTAIVLLLAALALSRYVSG